MTQSTQMMMHQHSRTQIMMHPQSRRVLKRHTGKRRKTPTPPPTTTTSSEPSLSLPDDLIIFHILPKLPVRCLLRFNSVSKLWYTTIHHPNFHVSQLTHAKSNPSLVAMLRQEATLICFLQLKEGGGQHHHHQQQPNSNNNNNNNNNNNSNNNNNNIASLELESGAHLIVGTCNGLTCNVLSSGLQICNPSTHELLNFPLPKPTTQTEKEALMLNGFGFDPVMNEYKVIHIWLDYAKYYDCRIFTLGTNKWRNVTATWNYQPSCHPIGFASICINGTLFWKTNLRGIILSFDLHHETFHLITAPKVPQGSILHTLFDREGCLCLVYRYDDDLKDEVQLTLFTLKDHHLLQLVHTEQLLQASSSGGSRWIRSGYIHLPLKPDIKLIQVAEFAKHIYVNWITIDGHFILWDVNRNKGILNKLLDMTTCQWALLVNHAESLLSLKTFVPPSAAGEVEVSYLSSREARHESSDRQQGEIKKKKRRRRRVYGSFGYLTIPYWLSIII